MRTAVAAPAPDPGWLPARLDRVPVGGFHRRLLLVSRLGWMFDAMDILMLGSVVAAIGRECGKIVRLRPQNDRSGGLRMTGAAGSG